MSLKQAIAQRIVERVSAGIGKPVSVTDTAGIALASSNAQLVGRFIACAARAIAERRLCHDDGDQGALVCLPLTYVDATVGAIALHDSDSNDPSIGRVSQSLAELIIHQMTVVERLPSQQWVHDTFIYDLLHERPHGGPEVMLQEAALLGIDLHLPRVVALINIEPLVRQLLPATLNDRWPVIAHGIRLEQVHAQLLEQAQQATRCHPADEYSFIDEHRLIVLAVLDADAPDARRKQLVESIRQLLGTFERRQDITTSSGVGRYYPGWRALAQSFRDARFAFETGRALYGPGRVFCVEDLGLAGLLWSNDHAIKVGMARRVLDGLESDEVLLHTLETFLNCNLSSVEAVRELHIHRHTLIYRLDKVAALTGLNPRHFSDAVQLAAALTLRKLGCDDPIRQMA
jgi:carbohydrate diacid regulator